ncbi:MAG: hypothetical protein JW941_06650 [Candidatus Coatesbacteria bacterium]|nr:hypothetical protein [Candidatus Coatesbacteria bacterium]
MRKPVYLFMMFPYIAAVLLLSIVLISCYSIIDLNTDVDRARQSEMPIVIYYITPYYPNSAGGVDVSIGFINATDNIIKYTRFMVRAYNAVGEMELCEIRHRETSLLRCVGPLGPGKRDYGDWSNVWYNYAIRYIVLEYVKVTFMNGDEVIIKGEDLSLILASKFKSNKFYASYKGR